jgi:hypothetical protein
LPDGRRATMDARESRVEDRATRGDVVGAIIASVICIAAVVLSVTFLDTRNNPSAVTSVPMAAPPSSFTR